MPPPSSLHGREGPLRTLRAALAAAREGRGQLIVISGDPGIGKSAVAAALAAEAESVGIAVTWGRAWGFEPQTFAGPSWVAMVVGKR